MVDPNTRQGKRTPVTLKIKFKSETIEQFIERYAVDVSQGGIFIRTKEPLAVGTQMRFEFQLRDASPLIAGEGTVVWTRENDPSRPAIAPGMGVRFDRLAEGSQTVLERILAEKAKQAPVRAGEATTKPPLFTDVPTKVAPLPVQEALLGDGKRARDFSDQHTPLPKPMPFHSDAEDFDEQAFEEATKVRALDELIAQTAEGNNEEVGTATAIIPPDELAARRLAAGRADSTLADTPALTTPPGSGPIGVAKTAQPDRDSAPGLPSPPAAGTQPRLLDTTPSPRSVEVPPPELGRTRLGFDAPKSPTSPPQNKTSTTTPPPIAQTPPPARTSSRDIPVPRTSSRDLRDSGPIKQAPSGMQAVAAEQSRPSKRPMAPAQKSSAVPVIILVLLLLAAGGAGVWFFYLRPKAEQANKPTPGSNVVTPGSNKPGSDGSAKVANGSDGSAKPSVGSSGSNQVEAPKGPVVDTVIGSSADKSTVEIVGTDQKGPAPFTAKLEKDKPYKVRISSPTFATTEMDVKGGEDKVMAKLVAKPHIISVTSDPAGALIFIDGTATGHTTPHDVELTKAQAAKKSVRVTIRKSGFRIIEKVVALEAYTETDSQMTTSLQEKLAVQIVRPPPPDRGSGSAGSASTGSGSGSAGSAATPPNTGPGSGSAGSAATPPPNTGSAGSAATPPTPTGGSGSAMKAPTPTPTPTGGSAGSASVKPPTPTGGSSAATKPPEPEPDFVKK